MTTSTLEVFKGEALENITILTMDALSAAIDVTWGTAANSKVEIKDKKGGTILTTLTGTDLVIFNTTNLIVKGDKFYALNNGNYFGKVTIADASTRTKIFIFYLVVKDV